MDAGALNCPSCGAAVTSDAAQCPYCRSLLQTIGCTRCLGMMFRGTKFCPHCGAAAGQVVPGAVTGDTCPRCEVALTSVRVGENEAFVIEQCTACSGVWMPVPVFDRLCSDAEERSAASALALPAPPPAEERPIKYLLCPRCRKPMARMNYARRSGVITDLCRNHGVWLDRDEFQKIMDFIHAGGLSRARQLEKERLDAAKRALDFERRSQTDQWNERDSMPGLRDLFDV